MSDFHDSNKWHISYIFSLLITFYVIIICRTVTITSYAPTEVNGGNSHRTKTCPSELATSSKSCSRVDQRSMISRSTYDTYIEMRYNQYPNNEGSNMEAYCMKCKTKREMQNAEQITMKNGRPASQGTCPVCSTKMFKIGKAS